MSVGILGIGWVTPLGRSVSDVWERLQAGESAPVSKIENPFTGKCHSARRVDKNAFSLDRPQPRMRRSSTISHMAIAAAADAIADAHCDPAQERFALIFATTNGGVVYTRRFFDDIAATGPQAGSPLLFPETVYNAPCSHVAAWLGITGTATTLVNDATVAIDAIATAADFLESDVADRCLVVAAEEADWITCEGYSSWNRGMIFGEGATAIVLAREGGVRVHRPKPCRVFHSLVEGENAMHAAIAHSIGDRIPDYVVKPDSDSRLDSVTTGIPVGGITPKRSLGECFSATSLLQVACAAMAVRSGAGLALAPIVGLNSQLGVAVVEH